MKYKIPVYKPLLSGNEKRYVNSCLRSGWISSKGEFVEKFEKNFSEYLGEEVFATTVTNGTVALHLALITLGIGKGDEVILPTLSYVAVANAINYVGAIPVFIDSDSKTWNIDCTKIKEKITKRTKAIIAVHLYGSICDVVNLEKICKEEKLFLIEDAAESFGTKISERQAGTFGDISTFSFFGNKTITTGEGGMIVSRNPEYIKRVAFLKNQAVSTEKEYWHDEVGFNYRMTNICAAIGLAQLENAEEIINKKRRIAKSYKNELLKIGLDIQYESINERHTYWMVTTLLKNKHDRDKVRKNLTAKGIETRPAFNLITDMPVFKDSEKYINAKRISECGINLPSYPGLNKKDILEICKIIRESLK